MIVPQKKPFSKKQNDGGDGGGVKLTKQFISGSRNYSVGELILTIDKWFLP